MSDSTPLDIASMRYLNESAIKEHALKCSTQIRGGKFTRVGSDFIDEVKTDVECVIRELRSKYPASSTLVELSDGSFLTSNLVNRLCDEFKPLIGRIIQAKVQRQPSVGCTLRATR